jgi:hypothetical protein
LGRLSARRQRQDEVSRLLLHLACVLSGLGVSVAGALLCSTGHAASAVCGGALLFALGAVGVGLQGWHAVKRLQAGG